MPFLCFVSSVVVVSERYLSLKDKGIKEFNVTKAAIHVASLFALFEPPSQY